MKSLNIDMLICVSLFFLCCNQVKAQGEPSLYKTVSLFVKLEDAKIVHDTIQGKHTWYTWDDGLYNKIKIGEQPYPWSTLVTNGQWIMKLDSASWALEVRMNIKGDDGKNIAINYTSFNVPEIITDSKRYGWMKETSYEAGGYFYFGGYYFRIKIYEKRQSFKFKRIAQPELVP